ncbi:MAG: hypothetical protein II631_00515 [Treponema sp.]|nr:hypothetical protein [Treponema sp.]
MGFLKHTGISTDFNSARYHKILCADYPDFLDEYLRLPILQRLDGVTLLCGTDWTPLFKNRFYYSRLEHSVGTALISICQLSVLLPLKPTVRHQNSQVRSPI